MKEEEEYLDDISWIVDLRVNVNFIICWAVARIMSINVNNVNQCRGRRKYICC